MTQPTKSARGSALLEALVAVLLLGWLSTMAVSTLVLSLHAPKAFNRSDRCLQLAAGLSEQLRNYVTPDSAGMREQAPHRSWHLPGDSCGACAGGAECWALAQGCTHDASGLVPNGLGAEMNYVVRASNQGTLRVDISVNCHGPA